MSTAAKQSFTKKSFMHGIEALAAFSLALAFMIIFKEPITELLFSIFRDPSVVTAIVSGMVIILGAVFSGISKRMRIDPNIDYPDFVNDVEEKTP